MEITTSTNVEVTVSQLQNITIKQLQSTYSAYFSSVEEYVLTLADGAKDNESQWQLFALARSIKQQKDQLAKRMDQSVIEAFLKFRLGTLSREPDERDLSTNLSLIKKEDLERNIAVSSFARRAEARYMDVLFTLNQRMALLCGGKKLQDDGNPMGPVQLAQSLTFMLDPLELDNQLLGTFSRMFEQASVSPLKILYKDANALLVDKGFLPNLKYSIAKKASASTTSSLGSSEGQSVVEELSSGSADDRFVRSQESSSQYSLGQAQPRATNPVFSSPVSQPSIPAYNVNELNSQNSAEYQQFLVDNIFQMQKRVRHFAAAPHQRSHEKLNEALQSEINSKTELDGNSAEIPDVAMAFGQGAGHAPSTVNLLQTVDSIQPFEQVLQCFDAPALQAVSHSNIEGVTQLIAAKAESENIGMDSLNAIDLVGKIFEYMLSDDQLPDAVKAVLSYLHTPFLKIALTDDQFLRDVKHPAKRLLDSLAEAGRRWVNNDGQSQLRIFPKIKDTVRQLMVEYSEHPEVVISLCEDMEDYNSKMEVKIQLLEDRARSKAEGEEQLRLIKRKSYADIKRELGDKDLPAPVMVLIFHPLADYLTLMGLRFGVNSAEWVEKLALIAYVANSVDVKATAANLSYYTSNNADKRHDLNLILKEIAFDHARSTRLVALLERAQRCALDALPFSIESIDKDLVVDDKKILSYHNDELASDEEQEVAKQLASLDFGTWLEFTSDEFIDYPKVKIAWYNAQSDRFMLSDNSGQFRVMRSAVELAKEKMSGRMSIVTKNDKPFFERALESVLMRLNQAAAKA